MTELRPMLYRCLVALALTTGVWAASIEDRYFDANGVRIRYIDEGRGTAVVLVHGLLSDLQPP